MSITKMIQDDILFDDSTGKYEVSLLSKLQQQEKLMKQIKYPSKNPLHYYFGLWAVTNSRKMLWDGFDILGHNNIVYYDTDSYKGWFNQKDIDKINRKNLKEIEKMQKHYGFSDDLVFPKSPDGKTQILGQLDIEKPYEKFKTLGAKKYAYVQDGEIHITVAGLSKLASDYLTSLEEFTDEWYVPPISTRKMSVIYQENQPQPVIDGYKIPVAKSATLMPTGFTNNLTEEFLSLIASV